MPRKVITKELKQEIINYYMSQPMTLKQVEDKYDLSHPTISKILKDVPKYAKAKLNNPNMNESFFHELNKDSAYYLGLIIADGNVFKDTTGRQASISITLNEEDEYLLFKFKEILKANTTVSHDGRGVSQFAIRSNIMAQDLEQYGVIPKKSYFTYLPKIPDILMSHLIRGIFDGDGSIQAKINKDNRFLHSFSFCGTHQLMQDISDYLYEHLDLTQKPNVYDYKDRVLSEIKIQNKYDMFVFGEWLYQNTNIFMKRKYDKYMVFKKHYNY